MNPPVGDDPRVPLTGGALFSFIVLLLLIVRIVIIYNVKGRSSTREMSGTEGDDDTR